MHRFQAVYADDGRELPEEAAQKYAMAIRRRTPALFDSISRAAT